MKSFLITLFCIIYSSYFNLNAQSVPVRFNYQVSIRDVNGNPISDRPVSFRISILENPNNPSSYAYREVHNGVITKFGTASLVIGNGQKDNSPAIESLPFQTKAYHLRVEIDENNGTFYNELVTTQLISVPYAMVASQLSQNNATDGQVLKWNENQKKWIPVADNNTGGGPISLNGDVIGSSTNNIVSTKVERIQNRNVASVAPTNGQVLKWSNNQWTPSVDLGSNFLLVNNNLFNSNSGSVYIGVNSVPTSASRFGVLESVGVYTSSNQRIIHIGRSSANDYGQIRVESPGGNSGFFNYIGFNTSNRPLLGIGNSSSNSILAGFAQNSSDQFEMFAQVKRFIMDHPNLKSKLISYACIEGPEAAAYERGTVTMVNGRAEVKFSEHFNLVINPSTITVNVTPLSSKSKGLAVVSKSESGIIIEELNEGVGNYEVDWEVKAIRKGFEDFQVIKDKKEFLISPSSDN